MTRELASRASFLSHRFRELYHGQHQSQGYYLRSSQASVVPDGPIQTNGWMKAESPDTIKPASLTEET